MEIFSLFVTGFLFGLRHTFDADHIAAISVLNSNARDVKIALQQGVFWGIGHTLALLCIGISILFFEIHLPQNFSMWAEKAVAAILFFYSGRIFWRFFHSRKIHNNEIIHNHPPLGLHIHQAPSFWIGALHGLAGSAAIFVLIVSTFHSAFLGLLYILLFGFGLMLGMVCLSLAIGFSPRRYEKYTSVAAGIFSCITAIFLL